MAKRDVFDKVGVIVVEDEPMIRSELVEAFPDYGFRAFGAEDAAAALKILEAEAPGARVVFTDVDLPGPMTGLALGHHIRKTWPWISMLITSGYGTPDPSRMPDHSRFVHKPYTMGELVELIEDIVRSPPGNDGDR